MHIQRKFIVPLTHGSNLWTDVVKVVVGTEKQAFVVHRHILQQIPFFEACLRSSCKESQLGVVELSQGSPGLFDTVVRFAYTGTLTLKKREDYKTNPATAGRYDRFLTKLYCFANFLMVEKLSNAVIDLHFEHALQWSAHERNHNYPHEQGLQDSKLMDLLLLTRRLNLRRHGIRGPTNRTFVDNYFHDSKEKAEKLLACFLDKRPDISKATDTCQWHTHDNTPACHD